MRTKNVLITVIAVFLLMSCSTPKNISYLQDIQPKVPQLIENPLDIKLRAEDKVSIVVKSKDPLLSELFNLSVASHRIGDPAGISTGANNQMSSYTIDSKGDIDFPVLGEIYVIGKTREELADYIKEELVARNLVKDPVVTVEFVNMFISVLGEVNHPGRFNLDQDHTTILEALSMAGDLTIFGKRENIMVLRKEGDKQTAYHIDLCSANSLCASPVFYLQQNDVIYVEPNTMRTRQSTVNGNNVVSTSFWLSLASLLTTIVILITN